MDQPSSPDSNPITLRIRFKSASLDEFIARYGADVSPGGIFIRTKQPVEVGTTLQFDFSLADGAPLLVGTGTVAWVRESDPARANNIPGMGLRFDKLSPESQHTHQMILAEKARKEGKASSTPYPPTAFVAAPARVSPLPEPIKPAMPPAKAEPPAINLAATRPAAATMIKPATPPPPASAVVDLPTFGDSGEFSEGGKTEISEKPLEYYAKAIKAAEQAEEASRARGEMKTSEAAVPTSLLGEVSGGISSTSITKSAPRPEAVAAPEAPAEPAPSSAHSAPSMPAAEPPAAAKSPDTARKSAKRESVPSFAELLSMGNSGEQSGAPAGEVLPELSAGAPLEETVPEKTEEVSSLSPPQSIKKPDTLDLGTGLEGIGDGPLSRDDFPAARPRRNTKAIVVAVAVVAAAAAFIAVYLAKSQPWREQPKTPAASAGNEGNPAASAPAAEPVPTPAPAAAKTDEGEKGAANKPSAEAKPTAVEKAAPEKPSAKVEKAEKAEAREHEKSPERVAKIEAEAPKPSHAAAKPKGESRSEAKADEKPTAATDEDVYRLVVRSTPISAEVLIDGEYFSRTPCERRILDPTKSFAVTIRKEGYEAHERMVGPSDNWTKKGNERVLTVSATLKRAKAGATGAASEAFGPAEEKPERKAEMAKPEPAPSDEKPAKDSSKIEPPAIKDTPKPAPGAKPVPSFDDQDKTKE